MSMSSAAQKLSKLGLNLDHITIEFTKMEIVIIME